MPTKPGIDTPQEVTRERIISAAIRLFGQKGYSRSTTRAIAKAAGINEVTLFRQFGNKKNLLMACIEAFNTSGFSARFETQLSGDYSDDIAIMANLEITETIANIEILRLMLCDARNLPELREAMLVGGRCNLARLSSYFQRQIDQRIVREDLPADILALAFQSLFSSTIIFENLFQGSISPQFPTQQTIRPLVDLFVRGTQAGD